MGNYAIRMKIKVNMKDLDAEDLDWAHGRRFMSVLAIGSLLAHLFTSLNIGGPKESHFLKISSLETHILLFKHES